MQTEAYAIEPVAEGGARYVLLNFGAPWCGLCRMVEPVIEHLAKQWNLPLQIVSLNADQHLALTCHFQVRSLPTLVLIKEGLEVDRVSHVSTRDQAIKACERLFRQVLESMPRLQDLQDQSA